MATLIAWYLFFGALLIGVAFACYRVARKRIDPLLALLPAAAVVALGIPLVPVPIHGGVTTIAAILWEEAVRDRRPQHAAARTIDPTLAAYLTDRFAGPLEFRPGVARAGWISVSGAAFGRGWYDPQSKLVWSDPLPWLDAPDFPALAAARDFCARQGPAGYWALPTDAELYFFWRAGGIELSPNPGFSSVAQLLDLDSGIALPTFHRGARVGYAVRCVARASGAPAGGYTRRDIALADWNEYQLAKGRGY